ALGLPPQPHRLLFFCQAEDGIRDGHVTGVQTCALPISNARDVATVSARALIMRAAPVRSRDQAGTRPHRATVRTRPAARVDIRKIGRASCRERGEMSGVAV